MIGAALAGIRVFATGGIGGVHRGGERTMDISADLDELARTPVLVVCAGPKSVLDIDLTLEYLETRGVPVVGWGTTELAGFYARSSGRMLAGSVADADAAAALAQYPLGVSAWPAACSSPCRCPLPRRCRARRLRRPSPRPWPMPRRRASTARPRRRSCSPASPS